MRSTPPFAPILAAAGARHGPEGVAARLSVPRTEAELRALPDHRYLSQMSLRVFRAGLKHELVDRKWPAFEEVWHGFDPARCAGTYDEDIEAMLGDRRLVRHLGKLRAVRANAVEMLDVAHEHGGSFGAWVAGWPGSEIVALWDALAKRFSQLGGNSAPMFLRMVGKDTFILTDSVAGALRWGVVDGAPTSKADRASVQRAFNGWAGETGRPLCQLSQILAMSAD